MTILIIILSIIGGFIALLLIIALFIKKDYAIERGVIINRSKTDVFNYIKYIRNQDNYSRWNMADPNKKTDTKGTDATAGFIYYWDSTDKKVGKGEQEIKKVTEDERIDMEIRFIKPFEGVADAFMSTQSLSGQQTKVSWGMKSAMKYPMNIMMLFMNPEKFLGKDLELSLTNLKNILEK